MVRVGTTRVVCGGALEDPLAPRQRSVLRSSCYASEPRRQVYGAIPWWRRRESNPAEDGSAAVGCGALTSGSSSIPGTSEGDADVGTSFAVRSRRVDCSECSKTAVEVAAALTELARGRLDLAVARLQTLERRVSSGGAASAAEGRTESVPAAGEGES